MTEKFVTKRPHKKSRAGCQTCKARKIKCDEAHPSCGFCSTRKIPCNYIRAPPSDLPSPPDSQTLAVRSSSSSSQSDEDIEDIFARDDITSVPGAMPTSGSLTSVDLRMMHHWATFTCKSIGIGNPLMDAVFEWTMPNLAFNNEFLMNGMLGIASLHMQRMLPDPTQVRKQTDLYRVKSFQTFREALPTIDTNSSSYEAALLMALMLVILTSKDYSNDGELSVINWLVLYGGLSTVMNMTGHNRVMESNVAEVFKRELTILETPPVIPTILIDMVAGIGPMDPDYEGLETYCKTLDSMANLFTCLRENGLSTPLNVRVVAWPSYLTSEFVKFAKENRPRAMVILSYYLAFLKLIKGVWWIEGMSDPEIDIITTMVGPKYHIFMEVPLLVRNTTDINEIVSILLR